MEGVLTVVSRGSIWRRLIFLPAGWVPFQRKRNQLGIISSWCENWKALRFAGSETPVFVNYTILYSMKEEKLPMKVQLLVAWGHSNLGDKV